MTKPVRPILSRHLAQRAAACRRQPSGVGRIVRWGTGPVRRAGPSDAPTISAGELMIAQVTSGQRLQATVPQDRTHPWAKAHREGRTDQGDKRDAAAGAVAAGRQVRTDRPVVIGDPVLVAALIPTGADSTVADPDRRGNNTVADGHPGNSRPVAHREALRATAP